MGVLVVHLEQTPASGTVSLSRQNTALGHQPKWPNGSEWHFLLGIFAKLAYAPPHICASTRLAVPIAPARQMIFSPGPTAGRKIRVYVLKAGAVYQK
jgi:hypothetical protein